jgi:hypothetical protein
LSIDMHWRLFLGVVGKLLPCIFPTRPPRELPQITWRVFLCCSLGFAFASVVYGPESESGEPVSTALVSSWRYLASLPSLGRFHVKMELVIIISYSIISTFLTVACKSVVPEYFAQFEEA